MLNLLMVAALGVLPAVQQEAALFAKDARVTLRGARERVRRWPRGRAG